MKPRCLRFWCRLGLLVLAALWSSACSGPQVAPTDMPDMKAPISSLAILSAPSSDILPAVHQDLLNSLAEAVQKLYGVHSLFGLSLNRAVWKELDPGGEACVRSLGQVISEGKAAYRQLQVTRTLQTLDKAFGLLPACAVELREAAPLLDLFLVRGLALLAQGQAERAEADFRQAVSLDTGLKAPADLFTPPQTAVLERVRKQLLSGNPRKVELTSWPEGAIAIVDGREAGKCPMMAPLFPGQHLLRMELPGHAPFRVHLAGELPPDSVKGWLFPFLPGEPARELLAEASAGSDLGEASLGQLRRIAELYKVDAVLLVVFSVSEGTLQVSARLCVPKTDWAGELRIFKLGTDPKAFAARLATAAKAFKELGWKPNPPKAD